MCSEIWRGLFDKAVALLDGAGIAQEEWTFGGGTALALFLRHRESIDVDIFLRDSQLLTLLTPRLNKSANVADYTEGSSFLKLRYTEGEIDFIVAPFLTSKPWILMELAGRKVRIETPAEIVIKKLFYRTETLRGRDVIDTAAVYAAKRRELLRETVILAAKVEALKRRWQKLKPVFLVEVQGLKVHKEILQNASGLFEDFLEAIGSK